MYHFIIFEENANAYLLLSSRVKVEALELYMAILDEFITNDYIFSEKVFNVEDKFEVKKSYSILSHEKHLSSSMVIEVILMTELENSNIYYISSLFEFPDFESAPRLTVSTIGYMSKNLDEEININLN